LLVLDEPTKGLDPAGIGEMRSLIRRLSLGDRTVVLSSDCCPKVQRLCDRVGVIAHGRLLAEGTVDELTGRGSLLVRVEPLEPALATLRRQDIE
jgi:ABC-2 type transport system ATP-binding protein